MHVASDRWADATQGSGVTYHGDECTKSALSLPRHLQTNYSLPRTQLYRQASLGLAAQSKHTHSPRNFSFRSSRFRKKNILLEHPQRSFCHFHFATYNINFLHAIDRIRSYVLTRFAKTVATRARHNSRITSTRLPSCTQSFQACLLNLYQYQ